MRKLQAYIPDNIPRPIAYGSLNAPENMHGSFLLAEFISFRPELGALPNPALTSDVVARLHKRSLGTSTSFGSPIPMFDGLFCHINGWEDDWTIMFSKMLKQAYSLDRSVNGVWNDLEKTMAILIGSVVPTLLDHLDEDKGGIRPCFIHGDLWNGNIREEEGTGQHLIFDSNGYYAHSEMELAYWRTEHHDMVKLDYIADYIKHIPPSRPIQEFDDRIKLYGLKASLMCSANDKNSRTRRRYYICMTPLE